MPRFSEYHRSVSDELNAIRDRIRDLVQHHPTDGQHKEVALRAVLRRHLPSSVVIGTGFVVTATESSTQVDILIVDGAAPTLFRDGDLMIVTPKAVLGCIEVKTRASGQEQLSSALSSIAKVARLCRNNGRARAWAGLFVYEGSGNQADNVLRSLQSECSDGKSVVNCVSYGADWFFRYWQPNEAPRFPNSPPLNTAVWRSYETQQLAPSYFMGNLVEGISPQLAEGFAWYPMEEGKESVRKKDIPLGTGPIRAAGSP